MYYNKRYMKKNTTLLLIGIFSILVAGGVYGLSMFKKYAPQEYVVETPIGTSTVNSVTGETTPGVKNFTQVEVSTHNDAKSCYTIINSSVYDLTMFVSVHEGGTGAILSLCGHDGTEAFMNQHKGGAKFMGVLSRFKIGVTA